MNQAIKLAHKSTQPQRHGCIIVRNGNVISRGYNKLINHPRIFGEDAEEVIKAHAGRHAEAEAIRRIKNPEGAILYVARVRKRGEIGMSKPCKRCQQLIDEVGIKRVVYTEDITIEV